MKTPSHHEDPKKSETIEVRVPHRLKQDFMARAKREGRSASEVIRDLMQDYVQRPAQRTTTHTLETAMTTIRNHPRRAGFAAILGAAGLSAVLAGALPAGAAPDLEAMFERMDADGDGAVTAEEMRGGMGVQTFEMRRTGPQDGAPDADMPAPGTQRDITMILPAPDAENGVVMMRRVERTLTGDDATAAPPNVEDVLAQDFAEFDADRDGGLSLAEFVARHEAMMDESFASMDANGDGAISVDAEGNVTEFEQPDSLPAQEVDLVTVLRGIDADGDGRITREEYEAAL